MLARVGRLIGGVLGRRGVNPDPTPGTEVLDRAGAYILTRSGAYIVVR